jgi:hypothetical protein
MRLKELFSKDIDRQINPAVVVDDKNQAIIQAEIEEYVFTPELINYLYKTLRTILDTRSGKTGIWVNGYYGSGKSHFIKYVQYCLNPETRNAAFNHFIEKAGENNDDFTEATPSNINLLRKRVESGNVDFIIFNIDAVSGQKDTREKITRILLQQFNKFRGYSAKNFAFALLVEKLFLQNGLMAPFKDKIAAIGYNWEKDANTALDLRLNQVLDIILELDPSIDRDALRNSVLNPKDISIADTLIREFTEYLDQKPADYRLVFLIDEVSQYIGKNTHLLLNLQTIIEEIGVHCQNKLWMVVTAQQTLDQVIGGADLTGQEFGKIMGRFDNRIPLESQKADYITKKRILEKNSDAIGLLTNFYHRNRDAIENQFRFQIPLYDGYNSLDEFLMSYPFIPYQFRLIAEVFEGFSNLDYVVKEVKDNERSVLGITHFTIRKQGSRELGYFIPFDAFFDEQFRQNLTHTARSIIDRAYRLDVVKNDPFAQRVVNVLFMVSNLTDTRRVSFNVNLDNITILLLNEPDANRLELQQKIQSVLEKLIQDNIIREEDGQYYFLKEDEIEISTQIQNTVIDSNDRLTALNEDIFRAFLSLQKKFGFGKNSFNLELWFDDKNIYSQGEIPVTFSFYDTQGLKERAFTLDKDRIVFCINDLVRTDRSALEELDRYVKTKKFIRLNFDSATGARRNALDNFDTRNKNKRQELVNRFQKLFLKAPVISNQIVMNDLSEEQNSQKRYENALTKHFDSIYKKHFLVKNYASTNEELRLSSLNQQMNIDKNLDTAEEEVNNWLLNMGQSVTVSDVINHFSKAPFGWRDLATLDVLIHLAQKDKRDLERNGETLSTAEFFNKAIKSSERSAIVVKATAEIDTHLINSALDAYRHIFNESLLVSDDARKIHAEMTMKFNSLQLDNNSYSNEYSRYSFGSHFRKWSQALGELAVTRDPKRLFERLIQERGEFYKLSDTCKELKDFCNHQISEYKRIEQFLKQNSGNFDNLPFEEQEKGQQLADYFENDDKPARRFPQMKAIHKELKDALERLKETLRYKAVSKYEHIFDELDTFLVSEPYNPDYRHTKIDELKNEKNIAHLKVAIAEAEQFKLDKLKEISQDKGKETVQIRIAGLGLPSQIESSDQMEAYLTQLRQAIQKELQQGKTIIIG